MNSNYILGIDIGGTKTAVVLAKKPQAPPDPSNVDNQLTKDPPRILERIAFPSETDRGPEHLISNIIKATEKLITHHEAGVIGISCGGPLDSKTGIVLSPPNLPGWDSIPIVEIIENRFNVKTFLQNDANAGALAEWMYGAGRGFENIVFLTFGTGMGGGLILNGKLYVGTTDTAGEVGHIRLAQTGPVGYGKEGSFEGFCSGSGISNLAEKIISQKQEENSLLKAILKPSSPKNITAKEVFEAAKRGDKLAKEIISVSARYLGYGLSILIDILNPQRIIIGSIFTRNEELFRKTMEEIIKKEALPIAAKVCKIVPSQLGESIGDYASLAVAQYGGKR